MHKKITKEYFTCRICGSTKFAKHYEFAISFHTVSFSNDLVYDKHTEEIYTCTNCEHKITSDDVCIGLREIKQKQRAIDREGQNGM